MIRNHRSKRLGGLAGLAAGFGPLKSYTFVLAVSVVVLAAGVWFEHWDDPQASFPFYGIVAVSYAGGFLIGWVFRKVLRLAALMAIFVAGALGWLNRTEVDNSKVGGAAQMGSAWVRHETRRARDFLLHLLPSGAAAGVGAFAGSRRRYQGGGSGG